MEEARSVFHMEDGGIQEGVELLVEVGVISADTQAGAAVKKQPAGLPP